MTREEAKKLLPIIEEYSNGKTVEWFNSTIREWQELSDPAFDCITTLYRIKSEPKYRPFKSQEECWNEMLKHQPFGWLINKRSKVYIYPMLYTSVTAAFADKSHDTFSNIFKNYTFADGTPFGIKEGL